MKETRALNDKSSTLIDQYSDRQMAAEAQLKDLEAQFITMLASHALGQVTASELKGIRAELALLKRELDEIPLYIEGLTARKEEVRGELQKLSKESIREEETALFERLKKEIEEHGYSKKRYAQLRTTAHHLNRSVEVDDLLENARLKWENLTPRERQLVNQAVNQ